MSAHEVAVAADPDVGRSRPGWLRVTEAHARAYRRTWRGSVFATFVMPLLFLVSFGAGLGTFVDDGSGTAAIDEVAYLAFLAPGLMAAQAMQTAAGDASWPVMAGIKWQKQYVAAAQTGVEPEDVVHGVLGWILVRLTMAAVVFVAIAALLGAVPLGPGLLAVVPAALTGACFGAVVMAITLTARSEMALSSLFRFAVLPMFLLSGAFFPVEQLPDWLEPAARAVPVWHGVTLSRALVLGDALPWPLLAHVAVPAAWGAVGVGLARRAMARHLRP